MGRSPRLASSCTTPCCARRWNRRRPGRRSRCRPVSPWICRSSTSCRASTCPTRSFGCRSTTTWRWPTNVIRLNTRRIYTTGRKWERMVGYAHAVRVGPVIEISGCAPTAADGSTVGEGNVYEQTRQCLRVIGEALAAVGAGFDDVTRTRIFTTVPRRWREIGRAHGEVFDAIKPVTSLVGVRGLLDPKWLVEIEASAYRVE